VYFVQLIWVFMGSPPRDEVVIVFVRFRAPLHPRTRQQQATIDAFSVPDCKNIYCVDCDLLHQSLLLPLDVCLDSGPDYKCF
jgi:hypothetical protein